MICKVPITVALLTVLLPPALEAQRRLTPAQLFTRYGATKNRIQPTGELAAKLAPLEARGREVFLAGRTGELRRLIAEATAALNGESWGPRQEFAASLLLRTSMSVSDPAEPFIGALTQAFPAAQNSSDPLRAEIRLQRRGQASRPGELVRALSQIPSLPRDLIDQPATFSADLRGVPDGLYVIVAQVSEGDSRTASAALPVQLAAGLASLGGELETRLARLDARDGVKATIRYPFDFARRANLGEVDASGLEVAAALDESRRLTAELEAGRDPLYQAKGPQRRHYYFEEAGAIMPYRLYAPSSYDGAKKLPLLLGLHGQGGSESAFFGRDGGLLQRLAEEHGYLVVTVLGYTSTGGYGRQSNNPDPERARESRLSEQDTMNVLDLVMKEYAVDPQRVYLMGHSMGGNGTWYLGAKYAERWAAIAPIAAGQTPAAAMLERLKNTPVFVTHGNADVVVSVSASRGAAATMQRLGMDFEYQEIPGGSHSSVVSGAMREMFRFFDQRR